MAMHKTGNDSKAGKLKIHGGFKSMEKAGEKKAPRKK